MTRLDRHTAPERITPRPPEGLPMRTPEERTKVRISMPKQKSKAPTRKVTAFTLGNGLGILIVWALRAFADMEVDEETASAIVITIGFVAGYVTRPSERDQITH